MKDNNLMMLLLIGGGLWLFAQANRQTIAPVEDMPYGPAREGYRVPPPEI